MKIFIAIIAALWIYSMWKFRNEQKYFSRILRYYEMKHQQNPDDIAISMGLASAFMKTQQYAKAFNIYRQLEERGVGNYPAFGESLKYNMEFCRKPIPGCNGPKNFNRSWWHNFKLVRLGARHRFDFMENHLLEANSMMRAGII